MIDLINCQHYVVKPRIDNKTALQATQIDKLNRLLPLLKSSNKFYKQKITASGLALPLKTIDEFLTKFPETTRSELEHDQIEHPPFGSNLTYPIEKYSRYSQTSGTTGRPMRWLDTGASWDWMVDCWVRVFEAAKTKPGDSIFFAFSFGPFIGFWVAFDAAKKIGCLCIPGGGMNTIARLHFLAENNVDILCCTPTYALHLAAVAQNENIDLAKSGIRAMIVGGEPGASIPATRLRLEALWPGVRIYDHHGMTEIGPVSYQCPQRHEVLHIMESEFITEVNDPDTGQKAHSGETGELVLTNLGRAASPLLRYRTGDLVRPIAAAPCVCGSYELAIEGGILGRSDDMVQIRGVNVFPTAIEQIVRGFPEVIEYRVEIVQAHDMHEMAIQIETAGGDAHPSKLADEIEKILRRNFSLRIPVKHVPAGTLPRFEMKAKRWVRDKRNISASEELQRLLQSSGKLYADELPVEGTTLNDLHKDRFSEYVQKVYSRTLEELGIALEQLLENLHLAKNGKLNLAGLLLFCKTPSRFRPAFIIKAVSFFGNFIGDPDYRDSEDIEGDLVRQYEDGMHFLLRNLKKTQQGQNFNSLGILEVSQTALEELLQNAIIHRDYFRDAPIKILIFDNRIEIINPGCLPNSLTVENIKNGNSAIRNPTLASFAAKMLLYRGLGSGILRALREQPNIEFYNDVEDEQFKVIIPRPQEG